MNVSLKSAAIVTIVSLAACHTADAAIVVGMVLDPATTAGASPGVNSIYSGLGTWHLFAVDNNVGDYGISLYNVDLEGVTSIHHTAPLAPAIQESDGNFQDAGYSLLRSANNSTSNSVHAAQQFPDRSPYQFIGMGQQAGNFADQLSVIQPGATLVGGGTSTSWGNYNTISPLDGKNWLFLAEGTYEPGILPSIAKASFAVYSDPTTFSSTSTTSTIVPDPITPTLLTPEYLAHLTAPPPPPPVQIEPIHVPEPTPPVVTPPPVPSPPVMPPVGPVNPPPTLSEVLQETEPPPLFQPPIWNEGWAVIGDPINQGEYNNQFIYYIDPTDPAEGGAVLIQALPIELYANRLPRWSVAMSNLAGLSAQNIFGVAGEDVQVDSSWMPMTNAVGVDHDGLSFARFGIAQATGSAFFDSMAMQDAAPTPEPAGLLLMVVAQGCLLLFARCRRR